MFNYHLKLAWLSVRRTPVLSTLMVLALGLGIGAFMTTFTVYYLMSGDPIPHKSDQLYAVQLDNWDPNEPPTESAEDVELQLTYRDGQALMQMETPAIRQAQMYASNVVVVPEGDAPPFDQRVRATYNTFFEMFDVPFLFGAPWSRQDDDDFKAVAILGNELNQKLFAGENSVGRSVKLNGTLYQVVGVIDDWQPSPRFYHADFSRAWSDTEQIFIPFTVAVQQFLLPSGNTNCWKEPDETLDPIQGFLQSECVWTQFWAELPTEQDAVAYKDMLDNYVRDQKAIGRFERPLNTFLSPVREWLQINHVVSDDNRVLLRLSFLFLLVCVVNTVGLLMAKFLGKSGEIALRRAMGASQGSVFRQNLVEVAFIGVLGGLCGLGLAWLGLRGVEQLYRGYKHLVHLDPTLLLTAVGLSVLAAIVAGLYPVWRVSRQPPAGLLKTQ